MVESLCHDQCLVSERLVTGVGLAIANGTMASLDLNAEKVPRENHCGSVTDVDRHRIDFVGLKWLSVDERIAPVTAPAKPTTHTVSVNKRLRMPPPKARSRNTGRQKA